VVEEDAAGEEGASFRSRFFGGHERLFLQIQFSSYACLWPPKARSEARAFFARSVFSTTSASFCTVHRSAATPSSAVAPMRADEIWSRLAEPRNIAIGLRSRCFASISRLCSIRCVDSVGFGGHALFPQKYFADSCMPASSVLDAVPFSECRFSGRSTMGAWYPLNWPFFLMGVTPRAIQAEIALHADCSAGGMATAAPPVAQPRRRRLRRIVFAFFGTVRGNQLACGPFQATSLLPWILWTGKCARRVRPGGFPRSQSCRAALVLTGQFQTALYSFAALVVWIAYDFAAARHSWKLTLAAIAVSAAAGAIALSAVMVLPAWN